MPFYILSSLSCIKNNEYKFGFSTKSKDELLKQYERNKRVIPNPFILKWWNVKTTIKTEKNIHKILQNTYNIENVSGEWYKCYDLLYFMSLIDELIENAKTEIDVLKLSNKNKYVKDIICILEKDKNQKILINSEYIFNAFNIKECKNLFNINNIEYLDYEVFIWHINNNNDIKNMAFRNFIIKNINDIIKNYILDIDIDNFKNIIKNKNILNFNNYELDIYEGLEYIEVDLYYDYNIEKYARKFINDKTDIILNHINKNVNLDCYFIKNINFNNVNIVMHNNKKNKTLEISLDNYMTIINLLQKNQMKKNNNIKFKRKIYFSYEIVLLYKKVTSNLKFIDKYILLNLEDEKFFELIIKENIYEDFKLYINNKFINIKKYVLYQILYYNKNK